MLNSSIREIRKRILKGKGNGSHGAAISDAEIRSCWDEIERTTIFLFKIPGTFYDRIKAAIDSDDLLGINKKVISGNDASGNICNFFVEIRSIIAAKKALCRLQQILPDSS